MGDQLYTHDNVVSTAMFGAFSVRGEVRWLGQSSIWSHTDVSRLHIIVEEDNERLGSGEECGERKEIEGFRRLWESDEGKIREMGRWLYRIRPRLDNNAE